MSMCSMCMRCVAAMPNSVLTVFYLPCTWSSWRDHNAYVATFRLRVLSSALSVMLFRLRYSSCSGIPFLAVCVCPFWEVNVQDLQYNVH